MDRSCLASQPLHFLDEETDTQGCDKTCPKSHTHTPKTQSLTLSPKHFPLVMLYFGLKILILVLFKIIFYNQHV